MRRMLVSVLDRCLKLVSNHRERTGIQLQHVAIPAKDWLLLREELHQNRVGEESRGFQRIILTTHSDGSQTEILLFPPSDMPPGSIEESFPAISALHEFCKNHALEWMISFVECSGEFEVGAKGAGKGEEYYQGKCGTLDMALELLLDKIRAHHKELKKL